jgi:hypothetical protein
MIATCAKIAGAKNMKFILSCMLRDKVIASIQACTILLKHGISLEDYKLVESIIAIMHHARYDLPAKLISSFLAKGAADDVDFQNCKQLWEKIFKRLHPPIAEKDKPLKTSSADFTESPNKQPFTLELIMLPKEHPSTELNDPDPSSSGESSED